MSTRITKPGLLFARCDDDKTWIMRTANATKHPLFSVVIEHIHAHGLVQLVSESFKNDDPAHGPESWIVEVYTAPEERNEFLTHIANADAPDAFEPCPNCEHYHDPGTVHYMTIPADCHDCVGLHRG